MRSTAGVKPISQRTIERVESLAANPGLLARLLLRRRDPDPSASVLAEILQAGELEAALGLLSVALSGSEAARAPVLDVLDGMVRGAPPEALVWLDLRARTLSEWRREWYWSTEVTVPSVRSLPVSPASAAGLASLHHSGFVREAAVARLSASEDPLAIAFLLIRANDWVAPVRSAAVEGLEARLALGGAGPFVPWLALVDRLNGLGRNRLRPLADRIFAALALPEASESLREGCRSPSRGVRRRCIELVLAAGIADLGTIVRAGLEDPDPVIRTLVAKGAAKALPWSELEPLLAPMLASTTPAARCAALDALWTRRGATSKELLERALLDPHPYVRGTARWLLKGVEGFDAAAAYRDALPGVSTASLVGAIEGLAEVGTAADASLAAPYLVHPRARVRTAAVHVLGAVGTKAHREALIAALSDSSPRVSRAARQVLLRGGPVDPERITFAALRSSHPHERKGAVELARAHDHWVAGILLLRIANASRDAEVVARASEGLRAWEVRYNAVFTPPSASQVQELESLVGAAVALDSGLLRRLRSLVPALRIRSGRR
jgi:HEAT repeat protein